MMNAHEIKHRAFHNGVMVYDAAQVGNALYWDGGKGFDMFAFVQKNPAVLMSYIGFNDGRDKDIYELDVLKDDFGRRLLVEWHKGCFIFKALTETNFVQARNITEWFDYITPDPIVIGNIFENPELLGGGAL